MTRHYIIARYKEPYIKMDWLGYVDSPAQIEFVQKHENGVDFNRGVYTTSFIPNIGREASSWLLWILNNYCNLPEQITFLQGNPFDHTTFEGITNQVETSYQRHGQLLECDQYGNPHHGNLKVSQPLSIMGISTPHPIKFCMGAQFTCSKEQILKYPYEKWVALFNYSIQEPNAPWELERCWETMLS